MKKEYNLKKAIFKSIPVFCLLLLFSYSVNAQNINFTIDMAQDDGVSITETLIVGSDTYVLLIDVPDSGAETLFELSSGDWGFYYGSGGDNVNTFTLTLTKNGISTNFKLNGIDYDTVEDGFISILNQDNAEISGSQQYLVGFGAINITNPANAADISGFKIIQPDVSDNTDFVFHNINVDIIQACVPPAGTATFVSQNCGAGTFLAQVSVTDLGGGTPSIFDGTTATTVPATGVYNFGPYPTGTPINFTLQHGGDTDCDVNLGSISDTCPPPCLAPIGTAALSSQDCVAETFFIEVDVTNLGSGGNPVIFDGISSIPITATGITILGPYSRGTVIPIILQHGSDITCDADLGMVSSTCDEIIFTINTAVDDDVAGVITETIVKDGDTYVLTVDHPGSETLDKLTSDWVFYLGSSGANTIEPFVLNITKNGFPTNFTLKGIEYNTGEAGIITLTNQDDAEIANPILYPTGSGTISISNTTNASNISSFNIVPNDADDLIDFGFDNIKVDILDTCVAGVATAILGIQDCLTREFFVAVDVASLGNGSPAIFDGTISTPITTTGTMNFGPYASGASVNFTLQHGNDVTCDVDLGAVTFTCPVPANDLCTGAIAVTCGETVTGSTINATDSGDNPSNDVFYSFTDTVLQDVVLSLCNSTYDTFIRVFDDCPQSNQIAFNDVSNDCPSGQSVVTFTAQPNITYYIMLEGNDMDAGEYEMIVNCIPNEPAPGNDLCANPTALILAATLTGETTAGATDSSTGEDDDTSCNPYTFKADVWYTFVAPLSGEVTIETTTSGTSTAASIALYPNCGQLDAEALGCDIGDATGASLVVTGLTSGVTYYIRAWSDGVAGLSRRRLEGTFDIIAFDPTALAITDLDNDTSFSYYPNPVNATLILNANREISNVKVFNMIGQEVYNKITNSLELDVDMSNLQTGAYFVSVTIGDVTKTIRVIKE
ncbi:T9SS type A sorting domain-containing protein [Lacinutrix sp. MEBiC02404]